MATTKADSLEQFEKILEESHRKGCLTVVHFTAPWASQCKQMQEVTDELAKDPAYKNVKFVEVEAENLAELSKRYSVTAVPTFILLKNKSCVDRVNGANAPELSKKVQQHCQQIPINTEVPIIAPKEDLDSRIKKLINAAPCMLFMKGNPQEPRCGFSRQTVEILKKHDAEFSSFDILGDEEIRQGLKKYSNWPTYPQLYIKGELIGGLDIIKEMDSGGELASLIPKKQSLNERLKGLINQAPLMVFMKGSGIAPKCGFSRTLIEILTETGLKYETFDILQNEEVRQGLKTFSNWPTYPQVYVKGELVGGLDIIKELKETGELLATLNPSQ